MAEELLSALMSGFQNRKGAGLSPEVLEAMQRNPYFADVYGGMVDARRDAFGGGEGAGYGVGQAAGDAMHAGSQAIQGLPHRMSEMGQQGGDALASVLAGAQGAMAPMVDMAGNMAEGFGTGGMDQDPELGRMTQAMGAPGNPEAYRNVTERPPGYDMGRMAGQGLNAAGDMIGGAMDAVSNVDADAVLNSIMGIPGKLKEAGTDAMWNMGIAPAGTFDELRRKASAGDPEALMKLQELVQREGYGQAEMDRLVQPAAGGGGEQAAAPQAGGGGLDPAMMQQLQQLPESKGFTLAEAHKAARAAQEAGMGREAPGFGEVLGGAVNGALGALGDRGQAAGGADLATIQQLQQILSPEELQAVIQDPQKMAEIQALLQQGMGGQ